MKADSWAAPDARRSSCGWRPNRHGDPLTPPPIGNYDMGALGLAGYVSARGWAEIHNPASTKLSIKLFNINNCARYMIQEFIIIFFPLYIKRNLYLGQVPRRALTRTRRTSWSWESSSWRSGPCAQPCVT
jgi:hypothetical protein